MILTTQATGFRVVSRTQKTPQPIVPKESRKSPKNSSGAGECWPDPQRSVGSPNERGFKKKDLFYCAVQGQPGSDEGSPCGLDQVPSPGSLISSSTPLVKDEQKQVGSLPCIRVWAVSEQTGLIKTYSPSTVVPLSLRDRAADQHTYPPSKRDGPTSTLALKHSAAWFPL